MSPLNSSLEGFSPELYIAALARLAHSDGIHPSEQEILTQQAESFSIDVDDLPDVPEDLTELPWATRVLVYRDAVMLSIADESTSDEEREYLANLATRMDMSDETADSISAWVQDYGDLIERLDALVTGPE